MSYYDQIESPDCHAVPVGNVVNDDSVKRLADTIQDAVDCLCFDDDDNPRKTINEIVAAVREILNEWEITEEYVMGYGGFPKQIR